VEKFDSFAEGWDPFAENFGSFAERRGSFAVTAIGKCVDVVEVESYFLIKINYICS